MTIEESQFVGPPAPTQSDAQVRPRIEYGNATQPKQPAMLKLNTGSYSDLQPLDIRPPLRRLPQENPFVIDMVDSTFRPYMIALDTGEIIAAIKLNPNPDTFIFNSAKVITRYNTMSRWVEEHWGDEIDTVSFSGSTFSFMAFSEEGISPGLTVKYRDKTAPYQLMNRIITFFRYNGCIYQDNSTYDNNVGSSDSQGDFNRSPTALFLQDDDNRYFRDHHPRRGLIKERMYVRITFDYARLLGYFDTFDITEDASTPYRFIYSAVFKAEDVTWLLG